MSLVTFIAFEIKVLLGAAFGLVVWQMLVGKIEMKGLLQDKVKGQFSPARVQALFSTLAIAFYIVTELLEQRTWEALNALPPETSVLFGGSQMIYLTAKASSAGIRM